MQWPFFQMSQTPTKRGRWIKQIFLKDLFCLSITRVIAFDPVSFRFISDILSQQQSKTVSWGSWPNRRGAFKTTFYAEDKILGPICSPVWSIWVTLPLKIAAFCRRRVSKAAALNMLVTLSGTLVDGRNREDGLDANADDISLVRIVGVWTGTWGKWPCARKRFDFPYVSVTLMTTFVSQWLPLGVQEKKEKAWWQIYPTPGVIRSKKCRVT